MATQPGKAALGPRENIAVLETIATTTELLSGWRLRLTFIAVFTGLFLSLLDTTIVAVSLPTIANHFAEFDRSTWIINAYLLTYMGFSIFIARLSDVFGRKLIEIVSLAVFIAFSLACALSSTMTQLIIFRAIQGIAGSGLYSMAMVIAPTIIPPERRSMIGALVSICIVTAGVLGPILGGAITVHQDSSTWPWIFWINLPIAGIALVILIISYPADRPKKTWGALPSIDFLGSLLLLAFSVLLVFALQEAGSYQYAWDSPAIIVCLVLSAGSLMVFVLWQEWISSHPKLPMEVVFPISVVTRRVIAAALVTTMLSGFIYYTAVVNIPQRFQIVSGDSPIIAGVRLVPMLVLSGAGAVLGGIASKSRNLTAHTLIVAAAFQLLGYGLMTTLGDTRSVPAKQYGFQIFLGFGFGLSMSSATQMIYVQAEPRWLAVTQGVLAQVRSMGASIGLAVAVIIFNVRCRNSAALTDALTSSQAAQLYKSPIVIETFAPAQQALVAEVFAGAFTEQMRVATYVAAGCFVSSLLTLQRHPPPMGGMRPKSPSVAVESSSLDEEQKPSV